jgi:hypothetical protein
MEKIKMFNTLLTMIGLDLDELIEATYNEYIRQKFISENIDLIDRCLERADIIFDAEYTQNYIYLEHLEDLERMVMGFL